VKIEARGGRKYAPESSFNNRRGRGGGDNAVRRAIRLGRIGKLGLAKPVDHSEREKGEEDWWSALSGQRRRTLVATPWFESGRKKKNGVQKTLVARQKRPTARGTESSRCFFKKKKGGFDPHTLTGRHGCCKRTKTPRLTVGKSKDYERNARGKIFQPACHDIQGATW